MIFAAAARECGIARWPRDPLAASTAQRSLLSRTPVSPRTPNPPQDWRSLLRAVDGNAPEISRRDPLGAAEVFDAAVRPRRQLQPPPWPARPASKCDALAATDPCTSVFRRGCRGVDSRRRKAACAVVGGASPAPEPAGPIAQPFAIRIGRRCFTVESLKPAPARVSREGRLDRAGVRHGHFASAALCFDGERMVALTAHLRLSRVPGRARMSLQTRAGPGVGIPGPSAPFLSNQACGALPVASPPREAPTAASPNTVAAGG
jgi:hypothetical protein